MRRSRVVAILILLLFPAVLIGTAFSLLSSGFISAEKSKLAAIQNTVKGTQRTGQVLAELDQTVIPEFEVNINSSFTKDVSIDGGLEVQGVTIFNDGIEAPNVVYRVVAGQGISLSGQQEVFIQNNGVLSLQGQSGAVTLTPGEGISIDGTTISLDEAALDKLNSNRSSETTNSGLQNAFRNIIVSGQNSIIASGADNLTFKAGVGISLVTDPFINTVQIINTNTNGGTVAAGWQDNGAAVVLSTLSDLVGIGTANPTEALDINGNLRVQGRLIDSNGQAGTAGQVLVASINGISWGTVESAISGTAFINGGNAFGMPAVLGTVDVQGLSLNTNNIQRIQISSAGLIGIGTNVGNSLVSLPASTTGRASLSIAPGLQPATGAQGDLYVQGGNLFFHNGAQWENLRNYWRLNGTDLYYSGGEVGIDTASPVEKLEVQEGNIRINSASDTARRSIQWFDGLARWSIGYTASEANRPLRFQTGNTAVLSIQENGNVGIGVNSPARTLDVNGAVRLQPTSLPSNPASGDLFMMVHHCFFMMAQAGMTSPKGGVAVVSGA